MLDSIGQGFRALNQQLQVLGSKAVTELGAGLEIVTDHHQSPVSKRCLADFAAGMLLQLLCDGAADPVSELVRCGDQH